MTIQSKAAIYKVQQDIKTKQETKEIVISLHILTEANIVSQCSVQSITWTHLFLHHVYMHTANPCMHPCCVLMECICGHMVGQIPPQLMLLVPAVTVRARTWTKATTYMILTTFAFTGTWELVRHNSFTVSWSSCGLGFNKTLEANLIARLLQGAGWHPDEWEITKTHWPYSLW